MPDIDISPKDEALLERWFHALWVEKGLSDNSLTDYRYDMGGYCRWLAQRGLARSHPLVRW